jgi:hypothetical protein
MKVTKLKRRLNNGHSITGKQAMQWWGLYRLSSAINRLRNNGMDIITTMKRSNNGDTYASYSLKQDTPF